jgi:hypothetical protein
MRLITAVVLSALVATSCQKKGEEKDSFQPTQLSVGVEEVDSSLSLNKYSSQGPAGYVTKADLWCNDKLKATLDFAADQQSVDLFASLENCELRLTEFVYEKTYKVSRLFSPGVYEFEVRDATNRLIDKKLVRSIQPLEEVSNKGKGKGKGKGQCEDDCTFKEVHVTFLHSVLDIKNEILVNDINVNQLFAHLDKEDAPTCDSLSARFVESGDLITPPSLEIVLKNCTNTIGTGDLEFGFGPTILNNNGQLPSPVNITDVMRAIDDFPIVPVKNGKDYTISLSFDELEEMFKSLNVSTIDILTFDFAVAIRNKQGISGLVYLIDNQCEVKSSKP